MQKCVLIHLFLTIFLRMFWKLESEHNYSVGLCSESGRFYRESVYHTICMFRTEISTIKCIKTHLKIQIQYVLVGILKMLFFLLFPFYLKSNKHFRSCMHCCTFNFLLYS